MKFKKSIVMIIMSSTFLIRKLLKMRECVCIRYTQERMSTLDARIYGEICLGKVSIVIKLIGVDLY